MDQASSRERRVRRQLRSRGYLLRKDRARTLNLDYLGEFMVIDADANFIVGGSRFDWSLDDIEAWLVG